MIEYAHKRVVIENLTPEVNEGRYPVKRTVGELVKVEADVFADGHDHVTAELLFRRADQSRWRTVSMRHLGNDRWRGEFSIEEECEYLYTVRGWVDPFRSWQNDLRKKLDAGVDVSVDALAGVKLMRESYREKKTKRAVRLKALADEIEAAHTDADRIRLLCFTEELTAIMSQPDPARVSEYPRQLRVQVDREKARFSAWYEFFPRSRGRRRGAHGTLRESERLLPEIARMGFDVVYLPPVHPIGVTNRKGKNNTVNAEPGDPGSPWAIGSAEGGHTALAPELGAMKDFTHFVSAAGRHGLEVALDLAFQCSPDHPYITQHPEWFKWRPDGSIQFAENPPKKYEDVVPIDFETADPGPLWEELKGVVLFWIEKGVKIFRVDNPHTKPFAFWEWLFAEVRKTHPEVIFLAEAFTRPKVMYRLAKIGFQQSYTYFTWRYTKHEFIEYMNELAHTEVGEYFRPNFWPNTPDILPEHLQHGGRPAFIMRLALAATLSSNYGIYGPAFELCERDAVAGKEEYFHSEKYEIKKWDWSREGNLKQIICRVNRIRRDNPALQQTRNIRFCETDNEYILFYLKATEDRSNILLVAVNLDPFHTQSGWVRVPVHELGMDSAQSYLAYDLLSEDKYIWKGDWNFVQLNPAVLPVHILRIHHRLRREADFDYFM
ncbi:MAG: DUF3416 domain-containing protein [Candidatus Omnitrophica bacterium]|nr:DUF3416 domain-containing protein [Candidatus Omnitrophota bacterium]